MSTFIQRLTIVVSCILVGNFTSASASVVFDDFEDGVIDSSLWTVTEPAYDSAVVEMDGYAVFTSRGRLASVESFGPVVVQGELEISDHSGDIFSIKTRTDEFDGGPGVSFVIGSNDFWGWDNDENVYIVTHDESMNREVLGSTQALVPMGTPTRFRVEDDGLELRFFVNDMSTPLLTAQSTVHGGDQVALYNRELGPEFVTKLDWVQITPEPGTFLLLVAGMGIVSALRRR